MTESKTYLSSDIEKLHSTRHRKVSKSACYYVPIVVQCRKDEGRFMKSALYKYHIRRCDECKNGEKPERMAATSLVAKSKLEQYTLSKIVKTTTDDFH